VREKKLEQEHKAVRTPDELIDLTIHNHKTMLTAFQREGMTVGDAEKQANYVQAHGDRCKRCGTVTFGLFPGSVPYCEQCSADLRELDQAHTGKFMWFAEMMEQMRKQR